MLGQLRRAGHMCAAVTKTAFIYVDLVVFGPQPLHFALISSIKGTGQAGAPTTWSPGRGGDASWRCNTLYVCVQARVLPKGQLHHSSGGALVMPRHACRQQRADARAGINIGICHVRAGEKYAPGTWCASPYIPTRLHRYRCVNSAPSIGAHHCKHRGCERVHARSAV